MFDMEVRLVVKASAETNPYANKSGINKTTGVGGQGRKKTFHFRFEEDGGAASEGQETSEKKVKRMKLGYPELTL